MADGFEHLKRIGAQKIHETTHISRRNVELILDKAFAQLNPIQFMGFISILEREYSVDLSALKAEFQAAGHLQETPPELAEDLPKKRSGLGLWLFVFAGVLLAVVTYFALENSESRKEEPVKTEQRSFTEEAVPAANETVVEPAVEEVAAPEPEAVEPMSVPSPAPAMPLQITPKTKLWAGIVDLEDFSRSQKLTEEPFELEGDKAWLLLLGHGNVVLESGEKRLDLNDKQRVRIIYKNGAMRRITPEEYIVINQGRDW